MQWDFCMPIWNACFPGSDTLQSKETRPTPFEKSGAGHLQCPSPKPKILPGIFPTAGTFSDYIRLKNQRPEKKGARSMPKKHLFALYGAAHFWVDLSCALLLFRTLSAQPDPALSLLLYNFCAFALQMPLGLLADRLDRNALVAAAGCVLVALAYGVPLTLTAVTAGIGNALFHLGGGIDVLNASRDKAAALGVFISPGALGIWLGTLWGKGAGVPLWLAPPVLAGLALAAVWLAYRVYGSLRSGNAPLDLAGQTGPIVPLFLVVVLRSYMGMNQQFDWKQGTWAAALVFALALGKAAGGVLMDRFGARRSAAVSLGLAAALYGISALPLPGTLAVFLFNMTMPVTLWAVARCLPGAKGFTFGLLTFGLFLGFLPSWMGWPSLLTGAWSYAAAALLSLTLLWKPLSAHAAEGQTANRDASNAAAAEGQAEQGHMANGQTVNGYTVNGWAMNGQAMRK